MPKWLRILCYLDDRPAGVPGWFASKNLSAGKTEILKLLIESEVGAYLVSDEEDEMVRVHHPHRVERACTCQLEPCIVVSDLPHGPLSSGSWYPFCASEP